MEQFDQLLTCAICLDRYRNPKLLPCQHSFCMEPCMEGLVDYVKRQVKCPECRAEHRIPYQGVQAFPTNVTLQRFLELHIDITGELPDPTSNQIMERCQVCSEKSYLLVCAHCDKKVCTDCKDAHMDVLKREISRISHQVRRVLHRLEDALTLADKNSLLLQQNSLSVMEEIDDIYRRLAKALKDRSEYMKHEVERYLQTELKTLNVFKYNMEQEVGNISSNCELVEKYISPDSAPGATWDDSELMDTKDIFLKTMEFIRAFDYEPGDYARRVRFLMATDPNTLQVTLATYGDLHLPPSNPTSHLGPNASHDRHAPSQSQFGSGLMRSKSDHRLTTQYRGQEYEEGPSGCGRSSPVFGRKFGERKEKGGGGNSGGDFETFEAPQTERKRFRSRFARHLPDNTFDDQADGSRGVRFDSGSSAADGIRRERERVLDTEDVARGPISGLVRLLDSPRVIQRVQETELGPRPVKVAPVPAPVTVAATVEVKAAPPWRAPSRQLSEDDEIAKQKRVNKEAAASSKPVQPAVPAAETRNSVPRRQVSTEPKPITPIERTRTPSETVETTHDTGITESNHGSGVDRIPRKLSPERFPAKNRSESSDSGSSEASTASSNASRNTGGATNAVREGSGSGTAGATTRPTTTTTSSKPTFTTRYLGRTNTPTAEAKEDESSSDDDEEETESEESEDEDKGRGKAGAENAGSSGTQARMERTDIGPLLARSANERGNTTTNYSNSKKESPPTTVAAYRRARDTRLASPPDRESSRFTAPAPPTNPTSNTNYGRYNSRTNGSSSDYGTGGTGSALARSRSTVYNTSNDDPPASVTTPSRYSGLASKYLNRSRHTFDDDTPLTTSTTTSPSSRYGSTYSRPSYLSKQAPSSSRDKKASKMSKSKSTHDVVAGIRAASLDFHPELDSDLVASGSSRHSGGRRRRKLSTAASVDTDRKTDESLSSWARYLKNKYGKGEKGGLERSGSVDESYSAAQAAGPDRPKRLSFSTPGHPYANKNRIQYKFGSRGSEAGKLTWPRGICCAEGPNGSTHVVVADSTNHRICVFDESGEFIKEFGSYGSGDGEFDCPGAVWVNRIGQFIVSDRYNHRIQVFDPSGRFLRAFGSQGEAPGKFSYPLGVTADALNFIYVCEEARIQVFQSDGTFVGKFGCPGTKIGELSHPHYIAVTSTNKVVVSDTNNSRIQIFDVNGKVLSCFGSEGSDEGLLKSPRGVAVDESGYIVVGDSGNNRIQIFSPDGIFVKAIGSWGVGDQEFKGLEGLACANGNIFAVDRVNHSVTVI